MDAKLEATLLKVRKHAIASLTTGAIVAVLTAIGWKVEKVVNLRRRRSYMMSEPLKHTEHFTPYGATQADVDAALQAATMIEPVRFEKNLVVPPTNVKLKAGQIYWSEVKHRPSEIEGCEHMWFGYDWIAEKATRITSPNGDQFDLFGTTYDFWPWAYERGLEEAVCALLGVPTLKKEQEEKEAKRREQYRQENHCGECPVCCGDFKRDAQNHMVHHGYKRPGDGYIHGDCFGVGYLPYEVSDQGCVDYKAALEGKLQIHLENLEALQTGKVESLLVVISKKPLKTEIVTPEDPRWAKELAVAIAQCEQKIRGIEREIERMTKRIADWKPIPLA